MTYMQLTRLNLSHQGHEEETIFVIILYFKLYVCARHRITTQHERLNFYILLINIQCVCIRIHVLLRNLYQAYDKTFHRFISVLVTHREIIDTRSKCALLKYSRLSRFLIIVPYY